MCAQRLVLWFQALLISLQWGVVFADAETDYNQTCAACHSLGVAGAPRIGDAGAWKDRIARGNDALFKNAINGYTGESGVMPPKGGFNDLSDDQVREIVIYMVSRSLDE